jgi:uncharacterized protein YecE (DUF72 family)
MEFYVGTSGYAYKEWKGKFYPEKIPAGRMLGFYSGLLNTVEINNTFYRMPRESVVLSWSKEVHEGFVFAIKAPQVITHLKRLRGVLEETDYFFRTISALDQKLGPVLFQFPKSFRVNRPVLQDFLGLIPRARKCAFEFRNPAWLSDEILNLLEENGASLCIADADENPATEIARTAQWGYLRLRRSDYQDADLSKWLERILLQKWEKAFIFFKHEDEAKGPEMAMRFRELVQKGRL